MNLNTLLFPGLVKKGANERQLAVAAETLSKTARHAKVRFAMRRAVRD